MLLASGIVVAAAGLAAAALSDLVRYRIPDLAAIAVAAGFVAAAIASSASLAVAFNHIAAAALVFAVGLGLGIRGWFGGGDAKLLAAAALWYGWNLLPGFLVIVALAGGVLAAVVYAARRLVPQGAKARPTWQARLLDPGEGIPYGVAIAAATALTLRYSPLSYAAPGIP